MIINNITQILFFWSYIRIREGDIQKDKRIIDRLLIAHSLLSTARQRGKHIHERYWHDKQWLVADTV